MNLIINASWLLFIVLISALIGVIVTGIGLVVAHCADPRLARAQPIVVEWPDDQ